MKKIKTLCLLLSLILLVQLGLGDYANAYAAGKHKNNHVITKDPKKLDKIIDYSKNKEFVEWEFEFDSFEDIPPELLEPGFYSEEEIIYIPEEYLDPYHPDAIDITYNPYGGNNEGIQIMAFPAAAGVYVIPGIGQVAITVTGAVVVAGVTVKAGSWLYNKISAYFSKKAAEKAADSIPSRLKKSRMKVDLSKFRDKNQKTPLDKSSGTFKNGNWVITRDTSGHLGYNGNKKAWKIGNPNRKASLDKYGNIIDK